MPFQFLSLPLPDGEVLSYADFETTPGFPVQGNEFYVEVTFPPIPGQDGIAERQELIDEIDTTGNVVFDLNGERYTATNVVIDALGTDPLYGPDIEGYYGGNIDDDGPTPPPAPCFATGTLICTPLGHERVETLARGDTVTLASGGSERVTWIGHRRQVDGEVIRIRRHALGHHMPTRDLIVSADHGMFLDGVLFQAELLVNGETIVREHRDEVVFWHVELEHHGILLAENAPAESYLDTGNRRQFGNCDLCYDPVLAASADPCAEMIFAGSRLGIIRAKLASLQPA